MTKHTKEPKSLPQAPSKADSPFRDSLVDAASLRRDASRGLAAAERLREYRVFLEQARDYKASGAARAYPIDRQVLTHAREALDDVRSLAASVTRVVRNLNAGGALDRVLESSRQGIVAAGSVSVADAWSKVTAAGPARDAIHRAGVTDSLLDALGASIQSTDARLSASANLLTIAGTFNGIATMASLVTTPRPARAPTLANLISRSRYDSVADAVEQGRPAYLDGAPYVANDVRCDDVALFGALAVCAEVTRHVRKIEDTGLETYRGSGAASPYVLFGALALLLVGGVLWMVECAGKTEKQQEDSAVCSLSKDIMTFALVICLGLWVDAKFPSGPGSTTVAMGTPVIHGVVRDFGSSTS